MKGSEFYEIGYANARYPRQRASFPPLSLYPLLILLRYRTFLKGGDIMTGILLAVVSAAASIATAVINANSDN